MNPDEKTTTMSPGPPGRRDRDRDHERSGTRGDERPWWALGDWRAALAEPEFVLA